MALAVPLIVSEKTDMLAISSALLHCSCIRKADLPESS